MSSTFETRRGRVTPVPFPGGGRITHHFRNVVSPVIVRSDGTPSCHLVSPDRGTRVSSGAVAGWRTYISLAVRHSYLIAGTHRPRNLKAHSHKEIHMNTITRRIA